MTFWLIMAFIAGTGFGWCLCSLVDIFRKYLEMKRHQRKSEEKWASLRPYLEHAMDRTADGGLVWLSYDELRERRKKQNVAEQARRSSEENASAS